MTQLQNVFDISDYREIQFIEKIKDTHFKGENRLYRGGGHENVSSSEGRHERESLRTTDLKQCVRYQY